MLATVTSKADDRDALKRSAARAAPLAVMCGGTTTAANILARVPPVIGTWPSGFQPNPARATGQPTRRRSCIERAIRTAAGSGSYRRQGTDGRPGVLERNPPLD